MLRTRDDVYQPGLPAKAGEHYGAFVRFAAKHRARRFSIWDVVMVPTASHS